MVEHILFLRHEQTLYLAEKRISGRSLEIPILEEKEIACDISVDCVLCSPALRCRQTLNLFLRGHRPGQVIFDHRLLERGMGTLEGQLRTDMAKCYPHLFHDLRFRLHETPPEGEAYEEFYCRALQLWEEIYQTKHGTVLICAHNQILKMLSFVIQGIEPTQSQWDERSFPVAVITTIF